MLRQVATFVGSRVTVLGGRFMSVSAVNSQQEKQLDPIQNLFLQKTREYAQKQKTSGERMVEATPTAKKGLEDEMARVATAFSISSPREAKQFPTMKFEEPVIDPATISEPKSSVENRKGFAY